MYWKFFAFKWKILNISFYSCSNFVMKQNKDYKG